MAANYKIGIHRFLTLEGSPWGLRQEIVPQVRPGVAGTGFWQTGVRGAPLDITSRVDVATLVKGRTAYQAYLATVGTGAVVIVWGGIDLKVSEGLLFVVNDVELIELHKIETAVGGLNPPSGALLTCRWRVTPIANTQTNVNILTT